MCVFFDYLHARKNSLQCISFLFFLTVFKFHFSVCTHFRRMCRVVCNKKNKSEMFKNISVRTTEIELKTTNEEDGATWNTQTNCNNGNNNASPPIEAMRRDVGTPLQDKKKIVVSSLSFIITYFFVCCSLHRHFSPPPPPPPTLT